jgi:anti-sigma regulatory factor (Ser/Thr protein kinase)
VSRAFAPAPSSVSAARHFVVGEVRALRDAQVVALLASELVTNAVVHAGTSFSVTVSIQGRLVRVEVSDHGGGTPLVATDLPVSWEGGRGLMLVDALADSWGYRPSDAGKTVWFEVSVPP